MDMCMHVCLCVLHVHESLSLLPQDALLHALNEVPWKAWTGRRRACVCVCVFVLYSRMCVCVCVPLVFLPSCLLSSGLNWGPERPINSEPARLFGAANLQWPNIMFLSQASPTYLLPLTLTQDPHPGDLLLACESTRVNKFLPGAASTLHFTLHTTREVSFSSNLCPLSTVPHLGHKQGKGSGRVEGRGVDGGGRGQAGREEGMLGSPSVPTSLKPNKNGRSFISFPAKP